MAGLGASVNDLLNKMHSCSVATDKGAFGEKAVLTICEQMYQSQGGILIHSYSYKVDKSLAGNIYNNNGKLYIENTGSSTEIDVLYVSKYRVFPIEVKAYAAKKITLTDAYIEGCAHTEKSPVHQNEMHCRHLYSFLYRALPNGDTSYIVPIVCMTDKTELHDDRSDWQKDYIKACTLNYLESVLNTYNTPLDCQINLQLMENVLREALVSNEKWLPSRY